MNIARLLTVIFACNMTILTTYATTGFNENKPVGWAMVEGQVTGSNDENPITVTTTEELAAAMKTSEKNTIHVKNTIIFNKQLSISGAHDKTIYGLPGSALSNPTHSDNKKAARLTSFFITYVNVYKEKRIKTSVYSQILCIFAPNKNLLKVNKRKNISNLLILYN